MNTQTTSGTEPPPEATTSRGAQNADAAPIRIPEAYARPPVSTGVDLFLDGNEGLFPPAALIESLVRDGAAQLRRYPDASGLERELAARFGLDTAEVLVTAGADDGLDRACRARLGPGHELVLPEPTFEMIERYAILGGGSVKPVPWVEGPYPVDSVAAACGPRTRAVAVVSPNNPTGAVATAAELERLASRVPQAVLLVDAAYGEFADNDLTTAALSLPRTVVFRTFSKAWGLAGLRVGYALGQADLIAELRAAGQPYAVTGPSLAMASQWLREGENAMQAFVARVRIERRDLESRLTRLGAAPVPSQANFVLARFRDAAAVRTALADRGIAVRAWPERAGLIDALRITCPGNERDYARLTAALNAALTQETTS